MKKTIAIIDDKQAVRERALKSFNRGITRHKLDWSVKDFEPLPSVDAYPRWLIDNNVVLLILDEKLSDSILANETYANHLGNEAGGYIRITNKNLPMYILTAADDIEDDSKVFQDIFTADDLTEREEEIVDTMIGESIKYVEETKKIRKRISNLSKLKSKNNITNDQLKELANLKRDFALPISEYESTVRGNWINEMQSQMESIEKLKGRINKFLKN